MKRLGSLLLIVLLGACPAEARTLRRIDANSAAYAYMHRFWPRARFTARCHLGHHPWCRIHDRPRGCGCSFDQPAWLVYDIEIEPVRSGMIVRQDFFGERLVIHALSLR